MKKFIIAIVLFLLLFFGLAWFLTGEWKEERISNTEAREMITARYDGEIVQWMSDGDAFSATIVRDEGVYEVVMDRRKKEVEAVRKVAEGRSDENDAPREEPETPESPPQLKTEEDARAAALEEVKGTVDDIDLENEEEAPFYLVEIETSDDKEATVQVNAISGTIMSVTWED